MTRHILATTATFWAIALWASPGKAMEIFVSNPMPVDTDINDSKCTLREAIFSVNTFTAYDGCPSPDFNPSTIHLPAGTYKLNSDMSPIFDQVTIVGSGASRTIIDANHMKCFFLEERASVTFQDLTIMNCGDTAITAPGGTSVDVENVSFVNNGSTGSYGSDLHVLTSGNAWVSGSAFSTIMHPFSGEIRQEPSSSVGLENSTISGSNAEHGIIVNNGGSLWIDNSTIGKNTVSASGIIQLNDANSSLWMGFSTVAYNDSPSARAINNSASASVTITSSIIMGNLNGGSPTCTGPVTSGGYNVFDSQALCTTKTATDTTISFQPFEDTSPPSFLPRPHGGLGPVYLPLPTSTAILNHVHEGCYNDQRGAGRSSSGCAAGSADLVNVVVMVGNTSALSSGDNAVISQLRSVFGSSSVSVVNDNWAGSPAASVVVVTGSVNDKHVGTRLRDRSEGIVILKQSLLDEMNMTTNSSNEGTTSLTSLYLDGRIPSSSGYTSGGYSSGNNPALTSSSTSYGWGNLSSSTNVEIMGSVSGTPNHAGFFRYWPAASLFNGDQAENFRVGLFATDSAAAALTTAGSRLLQEAVLSASHVEE